MKLNDLLKDSLKIPVEWNFIKKVVGNACKIGMVDYESLNKKTTLKSIFGKNDCTAILFHIVHDGIVTPIGHWCLLVKAKGSNPIQFFDSLGLGLKKILHKTKESPWLWNLLKKVKYEDSSVALQTQGRDFKECGCFIATRARFYGLSNKEFVVFVRGGLGSDKNVVMLNLFSYIDYYHIDKGKNDSPS